MMFTDPGDGILAVIFPERVTVAASTPPTVPSDLQRVEPVRLGSVGLFWLRHTETYLSISDFYKGSLEWYLSYISFHLQLEFESFFINSD